MRTNTLGINLNAINTQRVSTKASQKPDINLSSKKNHKTSNKINFYNVRTLSICSLLSFGSILGICCISSIGSVFSVSSVGSILSIASSASVLSIGSTNCVFGFLKTCLVEPHPIYTDFTIRLTSEVYDEMSACKYSDYKSSNRPEECDSKNAICSFIDFSSGYNITSDCEVRRKGSASWRDLDKKPSFKIKMEDDVQFGVFECQNNCPLGKTENVWKTKKLTLQNQVQGDGEIDAYNLFRKFIAAPLAVQTRVKLYKDESLIRNDTYVMLETIDDNTFLKKWFGDTVALYEMDYTNPHVAKFERYFEENNKISEQYIDINTIKKTCNNSCDKKIEDATESTLESESNLEKITKLQLDDFDITNAMYYHAAVEATNHWDSWYNDMHYNNVYYAYNGTKYFYIPSGTDQTFQCRSVTGTTSTMNECNSKNCASQYEKIIEIVYDKRERHAVCNWYITVIISTIVPIVATLFLWFLQKYWFTVA